MVRYLRAANVKDGSIDLNDVQLMNFTPDEQRIFGLRAGDVLVTEGSGSLTSVGASAVWRGELDGPLCFQNTLLRLRPRDGVDGRFLGWWARSAFGSGLFASLAGGANIYHLSAERVRTIRIDVPPPDEQRRIADFLDAETARIDALISKRDTQLTLLSERLSTSIFLGITGAKERGGRRFSGATWLGSIPEDWPVVPIGYQFEVLLGKMLNQERARGKNLKPYLRNTNVQWDYITVDDLLMMDFPPKEQDRYRVLPGDLLVCEGGEPGRAAIWNGEVAEIYYQKALHRVRPRGYSSSRWLFYCLRAATALNVFAVEGNTTTIAHLTGEQMRAHRLPFPARDTQDRIAGLLDDLSAQHYMTKETLSRQQRLLNERRQVLITAAVTGQIDVSTMSGQAIEEELS
ncbi:restriction endonuclease subunit S [Melissospora conviva]|uniref:restriction endonuclease subunit S n=1 Tax=Melissospora conviva TaxID=3388432 RepID=UPI003C15CE6C